MTPKPLIRLPVDRHHQDPRVVDEDAGEGHDAEAAHQAERIASFEPVRLGAEGIPDEVPPHGAHEARTAMKTTGMTKNCWPASPGTNRRETYAIIVLAIEELRTARVGLAPSRRAFGRAGWAPAKTRVHPSTLGGI